MTETCTNCRFGFTVPWTSKTGAGENTFCRFNPPEFIPPHSSNLNPVQSNGWCGKWQSPPSTTERVPAPGNDPNTVRSQNLSVLKRPKKGLAAIV